MKVSTLIDLPPDTDAMSGLEAIAEKDPVVWTMINRRVKGDPLVYDNSRALSDESLGQLKRTLIDSDYERELKARLLRHRPFHRQPLRDQHPHKVYEKARQVGVTELSANEVFHFLAHHPGTKWVSCVPDDAEILTRRGWLKYDEVVDGDWTLTLDPETHVSRWEPILELKSWQWCGDLWPVGPFYVTDEHRWPTIRRTTVHGEWTHVNEVVRTHSLTQAHSLVRLAPHDDGGQPSLLSPRLARVLGWVCTDGNQQNIGNHVKMTVYQSSRKHLAEIEDLLGNGRRATHRWTKGKTIDRGPKGGRIVGHSAGGRPLYGDGYRVSVKSEDVQALLEAGYKSKADLVQVIAKLSTAAREAMFEAMMKADGSVGLSGRNHDHEQRFFAKQDPRVRDGFQALCALLGKCATSTDRGMGVVEPTSRSAQLRAVYPDAPSMPFDGVVWCPRTKSGTWYMRWRGKTVFTGNTFPREKQLLDFSNTRVAAAFADTPRMARLVGTPNQVFTRRIGDSYWMFRSAWESNLGEGIDADGVTLDEMDRMRDKIEFAFKESLKSSKWGFFRKISTPTLPHQGIDIPFQASDQQTWMVRCERCGELQPITHTENIVQVKDFPLGTKELPPESYEFLCRKELCRGKLDRVYSGQWVAKFPDRKHIRGYHMSQMIAAWISATQIMQDKIDMRFRELWLCYVIGTPAGGEAMMVNDEDAKRACAGHELMTAREARRWSHVSVGIDWGQLNWVVVLGRSAVNQRVYLIGIAVFEDTAEELGSAKQVYNYLSAFNPEITIADAGYGKDRNAMLLRMLCPNGDEGRFFAQWYNSSVKHGKTFTPEWSDPERARVTVDRTITLKNVCRATKERDFGLPRLDIPEVQLLVRHLKSLTPFREIDDDTKEVVETVKSSGEDHLAHATGSALLGMDKLSKTARFGFSFE